MKVLCISGKAQNGKDTIAKMIKEQLQEGGHTVLITHYADLLKHICRRFFDWDGNKDEHGRKMLQYVGTDVIRRQRPDFWVDFIVDVLGLFQNEWDFVLIPDCRFPNELERMREAGFDTIHIRVSRPDFDSPLSQGQQEHPSETAMDSTAPDYRIVNCGSIEDLQREVSVFVTEQL